MTEMHTPQLQSEPLNPALIVAADQKLLSWFIISRQGRGTHSSRNSILGLLCKKGGTGFWVHVDR